MITLTSVWRAGCRVKADRTVRRNCHREKDGEDREIMRRKSWG